jgi:hypothetical protein
MAVNARSQALGAPMKTRVMTHQCSCGSRSVSVSRWGLTKPSWLFDRTSEVVVCESHDESRWVDLPMRRDWISALRMLLREAAWPPESVDRLWCESGNVLLEFRDQWRPFVREPKASLWRASFNDRRRTWSVERIQSLDYDGADSPP